MLRIATQFLGTQRHKEMLGQLRYAEAKRSYSHLLLLLLPRYYNKRELQCYSSLKTQVTAGGEGIENELCEGEDKSDRRAPSLMMGTNLQI